MTALTEEVYAAYDSHFAAVSDTEILAAVRSSFPNSKRAHYREHAKTPIEHRLRSSADSAKLVYRYFTETREPEGYVPRYDKPSRKLCLHTEFERTSIDLIADFILAEDHVRGLALRPKPAKPNEPADDEEYPPLGKCAQEYIDREPEDELTDYERARIRHCEICDSDFIDRSPAKNAKVCRGSCLKRKDAVRKRIERDEDNSPELLRYRERQDYVYPFYSPVELFEISQRGETVKEDMTKGIDARRSKQERGKRTPTDSKAVKNGTHSPNKHKHWRSQNDAKELAGEMITYNVRDQPLTEKFTGEVIAWQR